MHKIEGMVPDIGLKGKYELLTPWENDETLIYSCERVSTILDFRLASEVDVLKEIYIDNGLSEDDYSYAIKNNIKIVTLKTDKEVYIEIPDNYIKKIPDLAFVPYKQYIISLNLGLLPADIDLSSTVDELSSVVMKTENVIVKPIVHSYRSNRFVDWATHLEMEENRKSGITPYQTTWERIIELEKRNKALSDALNELVGSFSKSSENEN